MGVTLPTLSPQWGLPTSTSQPWGGVQTQQGSGCWALGTGSTHPWALPYLCWPGTLALSSPASSELPANPTPPPKPTLKHQVSLGGLTLSIQSIHPCRRPPFLLSLPELPTPSPVHHPTARKGCLIIIAPSIGHLGELHQGNDHFSPVSNPVSCSSKVHPKSIEFSRPLHWSKP